MKLERLEPDHMRSSSHAWYRSGFYPKPLGGFKLGQGVVVVGPYFTF